MGTMEAGSTHLQDSRGHRKPSSEIELLDKKRRAGEQQSKRVKRKHGWCESYIPGGAREKEAYSGKDARP